jgi:hypothetical protein
MLMQRPLRNDGHVVREDLHVARQHDELRAGLGHDLLNLRFLLRLGVLGDRQMVIGNVAQQRDVERFLGVVADDRDDLHRQFADAGAVEQIAEAVVELADHEHRPALFRAVAHVPFHAELFGHGREGAAQGRLIARAGIEHDAHEELAALGIVELLRLEDVGACHRDCRSPGRRSRACPRTKASGSLVQSFKSLPVRSGMRAP